MRNATIFTPGKNFLLIVLILSCMGGTAFSQNIGINGTGVNPDPSAMLDVSATDKGVLIPRVQLDDKTTAAPIAVTPAEGLLIYNETGTEAKGYYYWDSGLTEWVMVGTGATDDDWDRDATNGYMFPSNLGDQIGIGTNTPTTVPNTQVELNNGGFASMSFVSNSVQGIFTASSSNSRLSIGAFSNHDVYYWTGSILSMRTNASGGGSHVQINPTNDGVDLNIVGSGDPDLFWSDVADDRIGIGTEFPSEDLHVRDTDGDGDAVVQIGTVEEIADVGGNHLSVRNADLEIGGSWDLIMSNNSGIEDNTGGLGNAGQVLTSTGGGVEWTNGQGVDDGDWYYESTDSSMLRNYGTPQDCVLVGVNTGGPTYNYDFAVDNGSATGTNIGIGSVEYLTDESSKTTINNEFSPSTDGIYDLGGTGRRWDRLYSMNMYAYTEISLGTTTPSHNLQINADANDDAVLINVNEGAGEDFIIDDDPADVILRPTQDGQGWIGGSGYSWQQINGVTKNFSIKHPTKKGWELKHTSLEGPEAGVYYRGEAQLNNGKVEVELPHYFEALTKKEGRTVQLTPIANSDGPISRLAASKVENGKFTVRQIGDKNPDQKFYWTVMAERNDIPKQKVEIENAREYDREYDELYEEYRKEYYNEQYNK